MVLFQRLSDSLSERFDTWTTARSEWLARAKISKEYYYQDVEDTGTNYTRSQVDTINDTTGITVSINVIYPNVNQKLAMLVQTRPGFKVVSTDGRFKDEAFVLDKMKHGIMLQSKSILQNEEWIKEALITGIGLQSTMESDFYRPGQFNTLLKYIPNELCLLDPNCTDRTLEDMEGYWLEQELTLPKAIHLYKDIVDQLRDDSNNPVDWAVFTTDSANSMVDEKFRVVTDNYSTRDKVRARKYFEKVFSTMYLIEGMDGNIQRVFKENLPEEQHAILADAIAEVPGIYVRETLVLGDFMVDITTKPVTKYELNALFAEWGGRPYRSYGMVHFTIGMQEAYDKMIQMFILNGILTNNAGWIAPKGSIAPEDKPKWEQFGANPQVIKEYVPKEIGGKPIKPEREKVEPLSNFYPVMMNMLEEHIKKSTGITDVLTGDASENKIDTFSTFQQYQSSAMQRVILSTMHVNTALMQVGEVLTELMIANIAPETNYVFFDEKGDLNEIKVAKEVARTIKLGSFGVASIPATNLPTKNMAAGIALMEVAQSTSNPATRELYTQKGLELMEITGVDQLNEDVDIVRRTEQALSAANEDLKRLKELNKQMENKLINTEIDNKVLKKTLQALEGIAEQKGREEEKTKTEASLVQ